jgi:signal transduction histidine kinase
MIYSNHSILSPDGVSNNGSGSTGRSYGVSFDMTDMKEGLLPLEQSTFLMKMSSCLRMPIYEMYSLVQLLSGEVLNVEQNGLISVVQKSHERLVELVEGTTDLSKIERVCFFLDYKTFDAMEDNCAILEDCQT